MKTYIKIKRKIDRILRKFGYVHILPNQKIINIDDWEVRELVARYEFPKLEIIRSEFVGKYNEQEVVDRLLREIKDYIIVTKEDMSNSRCDQRNTILYTGRIFLVDKR